MTNITFRFLRAGHGLLRRFALLTACLAREPDRRPDSAEEFRTALEPYAREPIGRGS